MWKDNWEETSLSSLILLQFENKIRFENRIWYFVDFEFQK